MTYNILGLDYDLSDGIRNVAEMQNYFVECANDIYVKWETELTKRNMDELMMTIDEEFVCYIMEASKKAISRLSEYKIYTYNVDAFIDKIDEAGLANVWFETKAEIENEYIAILEEVEQAVEYREYRKANRTRKIGLNARGISEAQQYNMTSNTVHTIANALGNMSSNATAKKKKAKLLPKALEKFEEAFKYVIRSFTYVTISIILDECHETLEYYAPSTNDTKKAFSLLENVIEGHVPQDELPNIVHEILELDPLMEETYIYLVGEYGDESGEIHRLTNALYITSVAEFVSDILKTKLCNVNYAEKEEVVNARQEIIELCQRMGVSNESWLVPLDKILALYNKSEMSCDGHIYDDVEEYNVAKAELNEFREFTSNLDGNDESVLLEIKNKVEKYHSVSKEKYLNFIKQALEDYDCRYRVVEDVEYATREEADDVKAGLDFVADLIEKTDLSDIKKLQSAKDRITASNYSCSPVQKCSEYITDCMEAIEELNGKINKKEYTGRLEQASYMYDLMLSYHKTKFLNCVEESTRAILEEMLTDFRTINDKNCSTFLDANQTYYKKLNNAHLYLKNIVQKVEGKKSFFSKIADGTKELLYKGYEPDYNYFCNIYGDVLPEIPADIKTTLSNMDKEYNANFSQLQSEYQDKYQALGERWTLEETVLEGNSILEDEYVVTNEEINEIVLKCVGKNMKLNYLSK